MTIKTRVAAVEGLFTLDDEPCLIGGKAASRDSYFFPKHLAGSDPAALGDEIVEVRLSRRGRVWSYTNSAYPPPPPFVVQTEPFVPVVIAAVELEAEKMVVLGQVVPGYSVEDIAVGMEMEITLGTLYADDEHEYVVWMWQPVVATATNAKGGVA
jgi:uncharacterized OB-fold protein